MPWDNEIGQQSNVDEDTEYCGQTEQDFKDIIYAYASIVGRSVQKTEKENQDAYITCENLVDGIHLFAVCDGHGKNGAFCSTKVKHWLPTLLKRELKKQDFNRSEYERDYFKFTMHR